MKIFSRARIFVLTVIVRKSFGRVHPVIIDDGRPQRRNTVASNGNNYEFTGSLLMHPNSLDSFRSNAIVNYLSTCADIPLDLESCIVPTFLNSTAFNSSFFESACGEEFEHAMDTLERSYYSAHQDCLTIENRHDTDEAATNLRNAIEAGQCWEKLCEHEDITLNIESGWMETCASINLPSPTHDPEDVFYPDRHHHNNVLACMLHFAMTSSTTEFGSLGGGSSVPGNTCYRSDIDNIASLCPSSVGHAALEKCYTESYHHDHDHHDMSFYYQNRFSYDYGPHDNEEEEMSQYIEELCSLLTSLSSQQGKDCLDSLCDMRVSKDPSQAPPTTPTTIPSVLPQSPPPSTSPPTQIDSTAPSPVPSAQPTYGEVQAIINVVFASSFMLSGSATTVPIDNEELYLFVKVLENSITKNLSNDLSGTATAISARIDALGGISFRNSNNNRHRILHLRNLEDADGSTMVEFSVLASRDCFHAECNDMKVSDEILDEYTTKLEQSVKTGSMETAIQVEANLHESKQLKDAIVNSESYNLISHESRVRLPHDNENDGFVPSQDSYFHDSPRSPELSSSASTRRTNDLNTNYTFMIVSSIVAAYVVTILIVSFALE